MNLGRHLNAEWAHAIAECLGARHEPRHNFIRYHLRRTYGEDLGGGTELLTSNVGMHAIASLGSGQISERLRRGFMAWGALPRLRPCHVGHAQNGERTHRSVLHSEKHEVVYRALRPEEDPENGLCAASAPREGMRTVQDHVRKGSRMKTHCIATTTDIRVAFAYATMWRDSSGPGGATRTPTRIAAIRSAIATETASMHDVSSVTALEKEQIPKKSITGKLAAGSKEIVFHTAGKAAEIPKSAILGVLDAPLEHGQKKKGVSKADYLRTVPEATLKALTEFQGRMQQARRRAQKDDGKCLPEEKLRVDKGDWSVDEVLTQRLFYNLHSNEHAKLGERADARGEQLMLEWAAAGVARVANIMHSSGSRVKTAHEFYSQHPKLQRGVYEEIVSLMPSEWHRTLEEANTRTTGWWAQGQNFMHVTEHAVHTYERDAGSERLRRAAHETQVDPHTAQRCVVRRTCAPTEKQKPADTPQHAAQLLKQDTPYAVVSVRAARNAEPTENVVVQQKRTLVEKSPLTLDRLDIRAHSRLLAAEEWSMPRTFDWLAANHHFGDEYSHLDERGYRLKVKEICAGIRHHVIPPSMQDILYSIVTSSVWMGHRRQGQEQHCARTQCAERGRDHATFESVEHAYCDCPNGVAQLWDWALQLWRENTGEPLVRSHATVLLADRGEHAKAETEEAWRATHAVIMAVIHKAREAMRPDRRSGVAAEQTSLTQMKRQARVELDRLVSRRAGRSMRNKDKREFEERWLQAGMAKREQNGHVHATCLSRVRSEAHRCEKSLGERRVYTDGSMDPKKKNARAGYGIAEYEVTADGREKFLSARYGKVITSPRHSMFQGATRHSNNTGELTALLRAVQGEMGAHGRTTFVVDSAYAINMATGRTTPANGRSGTNRLLAVRLRIAYRLLQLERGDNVGIQHVRSHTGNRGNDAADKLAKMGAEIEEGHRVVERGSAEPPLGRDEHKDNG